jgi:hypothetical protein
MRTCGLLAPLTQTPAAVTEQVPAAGVVEPLGHRPSRPPKNWCVGDG